MGSSLAKQFPIRKSISSDRAITIENLAELLQKSNCLETKNHNGYGQLHTIKYKNEILYVGKSTTSIPPSKQSLHWLIQPSNILVVPLYTKFQDLNGEKFKILKGQQDQASILNFIKEVSEFLKDKEIGMSRNKLAFSQKWAIMGQNNSNNSLWNYHYILKNGRQYEKPYIYGIYFSPQLMKSLSKQKLYPKININKSDTFILGIMLLQLISKSQLHRDIYNYQNYEIRLKPIIKVMNQIRIMFGNFIYQILIKMLQIQPQQRISFFQIIQEINNYQILTVEKQNQMDVKKTNETQYFQKPIRSPLTKIQALSDSSRNKQFGRSPGAIRKNFQSSSRAKYGIVVNKSPIKNRKRLNSIYNKIMRS